MKIICNTGPLIALSHISKLDLLISVFSEVIIPIKVYEEFTFKSYILLPDFVRVKKVEKIDPFLKKELDKGEAEVLSLAIDEKPDYVLIDEKKGRKIAELYYSLPILGTAGLLLIAKKKGFVKEIKSFLQEIKNQGYFISDSIVEQTLKKANE